MHGTMFRLLGNIDVLLCTIAAAAMLEVHYVGEV